MKKRILALLMATVMMLSLLTGCGNSKVDLAAYEGVWAEENLSYENGGFIMTVTVEEDVTTLLCEYANENIGTINGGISKEISSDDIRKNIVTIEDAEDDWGNVVDINVTFNEDTIVCEVTEIKEADSVPVFYEGTYTLVKNADALQILSETRWTDAMGVKADDYADEPTNGIVSEKWIEKGGIRYDDIEATMAVSMSQIMEDIENNNVFDGKYELVEMLPITGEYVDFTNGADEYRVTLHAYVSKNQKMYEKIFKMTYQYNDIGGWQYKSDSFYISSDDTPIANSANLFAVYGKKLSSFGYDDYPQEAPLSLGEIADDILYGKHNILTVYDKTLVFDIKSIDVVKGDYWNNDFADYLTLVVKVSLTNSLYDSEIEYELDYQKFAAGGWELSHTENMVKKKNHTPKTVTYSDKAFLNAASRHFHEISAVNSSEAKNESGELTKKINYSAKRKFNYLTEVYDINLTAMFSNNNWRENIDVNLINVDYSRMIGVWEGESNGETFRLTIINMALDNSNSNGTVSYILETSLASERNNRAETAKLNIGSAYFPYQQKNYTLSCHPEELSSFTSTANKEFKASIEIHRDNGIVISYATIVNESGSMEFDHGNDIVLKKVS